MRTIKFRAWDFPEKTMSPVSELFWSAKGLRANGPGYHLGANGNDLVEDNNIALMQFTGLTDKNGKEIYEGDIVKFADMWGDIYWWNKKSAFHINANSEHGGEGSPSLEMYRTYVEVIGNIYENPELLNPQQNDN